MANNLADVIECCKNPEKWRDDVLKELFSFEKKLRQIYLPDWIEKHLTEDKAHAAELENAIRLFIEKEILAKSL